MKLVISDAHEGLKAAAAKVLKATWQRCRVHFLRNALAHAGKGQRQMVLAMINTVFAQETARGGHRPMAHRRRSAAREVPEARRADGRRRARRAGLHGLPEGASRADPLDQSARAAQRRDQAAHQTSSASSPTRPPITRLVGACCSSRTTSGQLQRRYMQLEGLQTLSDNQSARLSAVVS